MYRGTNELNSLTIDARRLCLWVRERIMRRSCWLVQTGGSLCLHVSWHAWLPLLFLRGRSETSTLPATSHDALEEVRRAVADAGWGRLRWSAMLALRWSSSRFQLAVQTGDFFLIPTPLVLDVLQ